MVKVYILTVLLLHRLDFTIQDTTVSQQQTTCLEYLTNMTEPGTTNLLGLIEIPSPSVYDEYYLKIALNTHNEITKRNSLGTRDFRLELARTLYDTIRDVRQGKPLLYHIYYPSHKPMPTVSAIWFNNQQICPDLGPNGNINATIELGHIVYPPSKNSWLWYRNSSNYRIDNPNQDRLTYLSHSIRPTIAPSVEFANNECGITNYYTDSANRLYPNSQETFPGQWPWVVAIFKKKTLDFEDFINFRCAGSLLTPTHVITAAFCLWNILLKRFEDPNNFIVALGVHNLSKWNETSRINMVVANFTVHPDYDRVKNTFAADSNLAIVSLSQSVEYSPFIKPICLRSASTKLQNVFNSSGYNVGWDKTCCDFGFERLDYLRMARVSTMSQETCFQGLSKMYSDVTSLPNRTFCANEYEDVSCSNPGGAGNGLFIFDDTTGRYYLHGIRSRSICDFVGYVNYVDVIEYLPWIQQQISIT